MPTPALTASLLALAWHGLAAAGLAAEPPRTRPIVGIPLAAPLEAQAAGPAFGAMRLQVDAEAWAQLDAAEIAWMDGVPLSDGSTVDLRMMRVHPFSPDARIVQMVPGRDGAPVERELPLPSISAWRGCVAGFPDSSAVIVRSDAGVQGWIQFDHRTEIISSGDPAGGDAAISAAPPAELYDMYAPAAAHVGPRVVVARTRGWLRWVLQL